MTYNLEQREYMGYPAPNGLLGIHMAFCWVPSNDTKVVIYLPFVSVNDSFPFLSFSLDITATFV